MLSLKYFWLLALNACLFAGCKAQQKSASFQNTKPVIAFPGAEGWGKYTSGGRDGIVYIVTNLNDNGPGSFRTGAGLNESAIIVFKVSGTIHLETPLKIKSNKTIAGQTAPGDGICIADRSVLIAGDNIIVRYLRFRMGDKYQRGGMVDGNGGDDAFGGTRRIHIIIDHCSMSWSTDEAFSVYAGDSTTLQWNIISEPLNYSYHFEAGDSGYEHHGYGGIWGGRHFTAHHNLFAHCNNRNPRFDGIRNAPEENVDYCNNVIYDWGENSIYAGEGGQYNIVNNYFKWGPSTIKKVKFRIVNPWMREKPFIPFGKYFVAENFVEGEDEITKNNSQGVFLGNNGTPADKEALLTAHPFAAEPVKMQSAEDAYKSVLKFSGASFKRDTLDERIIADVINRKGSLIDVQGNYPHGTPYELTVNAWPYLISLPAPADLDSDGIPDAWEKVKGLDPKNPADALQKTLDKQYTNIEVYINSLLHTPQ